MNKKKQQKPCELKKFDADEHAQRIYKLIYEEIKSLNHEQAIEVLESVSVNVDGQIEVLQEEIQESAEHE